MFLSRIMVDFVCSNSMLSEFCYPLPQFYTFSVLGIPIYIIIILIMIMVIIITIIIIIIIIIRTL